MPLNYALLAALFLLYTTQIHAFFLLPVVDPEIEFGQPTEKELTLSNFRHYIPMFKKRNGDHQKLDDIDELGKERYRSSSVVGSHMLKQPFLKFDFLRRNFMSSKL